MRGFFQRLCHNYLKFSNNNFINGKVAKNIHKVVYVNQSLEEPFEKFLEFKVLDDVKIIMIAAAFGIGKRITRRGCIMFVIAKVKFPKIYEQLKTKNITLSELSSSGFLEPIINQKGKSIWLIDILQVYLANEEEYKNLDEEKREGYANFMWNYSVERSEIIPFFCNRLDSFNIVS